MKSIRQRLTVEVFCAIVVLQVIGLIIVYLVARTGTVSEFDDSLRGKALAVSTLIVYTPVGIRTDMADFYLGVGDTDAIRRRIKPSDTESYRRFLQEFQHHGRHNYFELWDAKGQRLARSESLGSADLPRKVGSPNHPLIWDFTEPNGEPGRAVGFVIQPGTLGSSRAPGAASDQVQLVVGAEREALDDKLLRLLLLVLGCGVVLVGANFGVMPRVLRRGLAPLEKLGEDVALIDAGSLAVRFSTASAPVELHPIIDRLNALLGRLAQSFERERRFTADVAHELRTPLAELIALVEFAIKWPESRDPSTDREILEIAHQMRTIFERMLSLARGDQRGIKVHPELIDLQPLLHASWRPFSPRAESKRLTCTFSTKPATAFTDAALLKSILTIVVENAVEYAPEGGEIRLTLEKAGSETRVHVSNQAGDLEPGDLDKLFDRLWRKELARGSGGMHLGIGLSLARMYATAMGWDLSATMDSARWLTITLSGEREAGQSGSEQIDAGLAASADPEGPDESKPHSIEKAEGN